MLLPSLLLAYSSPIHITTGLAALLPTVLAATPIRHHAHAHTHAEILTYTHAMATSAEDGHVAYEALTNAQKAELAAWVRNQLDSTSSASEWRRQTQAMIRQAMARRAASGAPLDAGDILDEIMPHVRSAIPPEVREGLFRRVTAQLHS
ncbi:conserved hypothetical protein [Leishmania major strain Friedlin]|uniref:Transcription and mRNA export factor ENY2 n=1 Tax=Leishmania major TaxID=5664 RepID=Q4QIV1_LEIMA|nr:conserved hypothetical protein [Leishmania major strain Friedlin]CAJ02172.1 conserved hypothetical protein [Leishmania major strain Friedlin]|eukprot:XP_001680897.1 conserved hypothetical protein [Leishmania major strain Friedlin]